MRGAVERRHPIVDGAFAPRNPGTVLCEVNWRRKFTRNAEAVECHAAQADQ